MKNRIYIVIVLTYLLTSVRAQVNYVGNPSFEDTISCTYPAYIMRARYWTSIDSVKLGIGGKLYHDCYGIIPSGPNTWQYPRTGKAFLMTTQYCVTPCVSPNILQYPKNRLKTPLIAGKTYCAKMYVNINNSSPYGNDAFGMYFGDASVDTIKYCGVHLTYLTPQIKNPTGNIITDTLNWIQVSGTYTANGTEKYLILGNFEADANVNSTFINGAQPGVWTDIVYDDVSVIEFDLAAYAGPDKNINLGDSAFIGRPPEIGLECTWTSGSFTIGAGGGLWVKPTSPGTYSYVVTQNICGNIKTDTVNVNVSPSLISEHTMFSQSIGLFPQPANDNVKIIFRNYSDQTVSIEILDTNGKTVYSKNEYLKNNSTVIPTDNLSDGIYYLKIKNSKDQFATKKLTVTH